jgi:hypothetical protein
VTTINTETSPTVAAKAETIRLYETTILDPERKYAAQLLVVPKRAFWEGNLSLLENPSQLMDTLGLELLQPLPSPAYLPHALAAAFSAYDNKDEASQLLQKMLAGPQEHAFENIAPALIEFCHELAFAELVPFEASSPIFRSLANVTIMSKIVAAGTTIGLVAAGGTPFVLVTVPLGIVLCGAAIIAVGFLMEKLIEPPTPHPKGHSFTI